MSSTELLNMAESVVELARYLDELKGHALTAPATGAIIQRGFLNPEEELALRQLQISYWQSRNALLEIIYSVGTNVPQQGPEPGDQQHQSFLIAFAAAALLVDAARFLRERFHRAEPICRKLDEPDPAHGIPACMYETVQRSLTRPSHAWHLSQARRFYQRERAMLVAALPQNPWAALVDLIDQRIDRLRPHWWTYLRTLLRVRGRKVARQVGKDVFGQGIYQIQRFVSSLLSELSIKPGHQPGIPQEIYEEILSQIQPGDIYVVRKENAVTNYFLPGYWPHAALHVGTGKQLSDLAIDTDPAVAAQSDHFAEAEQPSVLEALKDGVRLRSLDSPLASDSIVLLRPRLSSQEIGQALVRAFAHEGKPYDFDFDFTCSHRLVCTEVVYRAYDGIGSMHFELQRHVGRLALGAEQLLSMALEGDSLQLLLVYSPEDDARLLTGAEAAAVLRRRNTHAPH